MSTTRIVTILLCTMLASCARSASAADVVIALHQTSSATSDPTVRIGDVARVFGGAPTDRRVIEQLDLESLRDQDDCSITRKQVEMRLLLAGYKRDTFQITGPPTVSARRSSPARLRSKLERLIESELARQFAVDTSRVAVHFVNTSQLESIERTLSNHELSVRVLPRNEFPIGRTRLPVDIIDAAGIRHSETFDVQVSLSMTVAIADGPIAQGTVIGPEMLHTVQRSITAKADYANPETAVGRTASRYIASNSILLTGHLLTPRAGSSQAVKRNGLLDVVINLGGGEIRLKNARAMESGNVGDTIEVLNPNTNRRINASIIGPNLATVSTTMRR